MRPRPLIIALVVSLALNLFFGGLIIGGAVVAHRVKAMRPPVGQQQRLPLWRAGDELPFAQRRAFRQAIRQAAREAQEPLGRSRAVRRDAVRLMEQPTYDVEAAVAGMSKARTMDGQARSGVETAILKFAATLSLEERMTLADGLRRVMPGQFREGPGRAPVEAPPEAQP